jgi:hypothetical protein
MNVPSRSLVSHTVTLFPFSFPLLFFSPHSTFEKPGPTCDPLGGCQFNGFFDRRTRVIDRRFSRVGGGVINRGLSEYRGVVTITFVRVLIVVERNAPPRPGRQAAWLGPSWLSLWDDVFP